MKTRDIESIMPEGMVSVVHETATCPSVKGWPDNAFSEWVASRGSSGTRLGLQRAELHRRSVLLTDPPVVSTNTLTG